MYFLRHLASVLLLPFTIPLLEEPGLDGRFGERYRIYKENVPRWIPSLKPWLPPWDEKFGS